MVDNYSRFSEYIDLSELRLPSGTMAYEEDAKVGYLLAVHMHTQGCEFVDISIQIASDTPAVAHQVLNDA